MLRRAPAYVWFLRGQPSLTRHAVLRSGRPIVRITPICTRRNIEPDALLMGATISDADLFDDTSSDFEELAHE